MQFAASSWTPVPSRTVVESNLRVFSSNRLSSAASIIQLDRPLHPSSFAFCNPESRAGPFTLTGRLSGKPPPAPTRPVQFHKVLG